MAVTSNEPSSDGLSPKRSGPSLTDSVLMAPQQEEGERLVATNPLILLAGAAERDKKGVGKAMEREEGAVIGKSKSYTCSFCKRTCRSKQALGGHRATHKGVKGCRAFEIGRDGESSGDEKKDAVKKDYRCSVCGRILLNAQGLGAHMRTHSTDGVGRAQVVAPPAPIPPPPPPPSPPRGEYMIDLNVPLPEVNEEGNSNLP